MTAGALLLLPALAGPAAAGPAGDALGLAAVDTAGAETASTAPDAPGPAAEVAAESVGRVPAGGVDPPRPVRTNEPGTGVFIGSGLLLRTLYDRESSGAGDLKSWTAVADVRHTPATHWVIGARVPFVLHRELERPGAPAVSRTGLGDASLAVKHRFFREVGRWSDRHMAAEVEVKLPTGPAGTGRAGAGSEPPVELAHRIPPGTGSVDFVADLIYQEGRRRFVYGGDLGLRLNTAGEEGYRFGHELRLDLDLEYILFPLEYRRPGNEVFVLLETTVRRKWADRSGGRAFEATGRTDLLVAPALQHIVSGQLLASVSLQLPLVSDADDPPAGAPGREGFEQDVNLLAEIRYAF